MLVGNRILHYLNYCICNAYNLVCLSHLTVLVPMVTWYIWLMRGLRAVSHDHWTIPVSLLLFSLR